MPSAARGGKSRIAAGVGALAATCLLVPTAAFAAPDGRSPGPTAAALPAPAVKPALDTPAALNTPAPRSAPAAPFAPAAPRPPTAPDSTARVEYVVTGSGEHPVNVPSGAVDMTVTVSGAAAGGNPGPSVTGTTAVSESGPVSPGTTLRVTISGAGTSLYPAIGDQPLLHAPEAGAEGARSDPAVFPGARVEPAANTGGARAVVAFTVPSAAMDALPATVDFGATPPGTTSTRNLVISTSGDVPLMLTSATADGPFAVENTGTSCPRGADTHVAPGGSCSLALVFTPKDKGAATGTLTLRGNMPGGGRTLTLSGTGSAAPGPPGGLAATAGEGQAVLSWMPPADDGGSPITGYRILRSADGDASSAEPLAEVDNSTLTYTDTGLENGLAYTYVVRAVNAVGVSPPSLSIDAVPTEVLSLPSAALAPATVGKPYEATLTARGGKSPYVWTAVEPLPDGLSLDAATGVLSGTPTTPGEGRFEIQVADATIPAREAKARFVLSVVAPPPPPPADPGNRAAPPSRVSAGDGGSGTSVWPWALLGAAGLGGAVVAIRRLRRKAA